METSVLARTNVRLAGAPNGRPLILVHGSGGGETVWHGTIPALEHDHTIVLLDHVGTSAEDLIAVAQVLQLENVAVAGHSTGATVAALAAGERPDLFTDLVPVAPAAMPEWLAR
jgi:sigma-B regulation protein RsbQ